MSASSFRIINVVISTGLSIAGRLPHSSYAHIPNGGNVVRIYSVFSGQRHIAARVLADRLNLICRKAATMMTFAVPESAFISCVKRVDLLFCRRKVPRVNARRVVAGMHQDKPLRDWAAKDRVAVPMGKNVLSVQRHDSISGLRFTCSPNPASVCLMDAAHENFIGAYFRKLIQLPRISSAVVAVFAQLSAVGRFPTLQAWRLNSLVSHMPSYVCNHNRNQGVMQ